MSTFITHKRCARTTRGLGERDAVSANSRFMIRVDSEYPMRLSAKPRAEAPVVRGSVTRRTEPALVRAYRNDPTTLSTVREVQSLSMGSSCAVCYRACVGRSIPLVSDWLNLLCRGSCLPVYTGV
jgi:hypothetical protein